MNIRDILLPTLLGVVATPLLWILGALMSGGGHSLAVMIVFFPHGMLLGLLVPHKPWPFAAVTLAAFSLQFPAYGAAFGATTLKDSFRPLAIGSAVAHVLALFACIVVRYAGVS